MRNPSLNWLGRIALLSQFYSIRLARKIGSELRGTMNEQQWGALLARANTNASSIDLSTVPSQLQAFLYSSESMLCHPLLVHYIRPAMRMASVAGYSAAGIPVIANPNLNFGGHAIQLEPSGLKITEIPLGLIFLFRELGRAILNLHNAIENEQTSDIPQAAKACSLLSFLINQPAPIAFNAGSALFKHTPFKNKAFAVQFTQNLAIFVMLHEMGHVCKAHNLNPFSEDESKSQEHEADIFAMECLFAPKKDIPRFAIYRKIQMAVVCHWLTLMDIQAETSGANLYGYPSFAARRRKLLEHFGATDSVSDHLRTSVYQFEREVRLVHSDVSRIVEPMIATFAKMLRTADEVNHRL